MNKRERKRLHDVYVEAAALIDSEQQRYSCCAVDAADYRNESVFRYSIFLRPANSGYLLSAGDFFKAHKGRFIEQKQHRVLALLIAAQAALTGDIE